ncbi:4'-demethylrebeccamycin synthase [Podospora fimiseda]|uniref:4'-demethylrebeccamycin synthase n=1 Tax=Podospora fimiseda TaxID=252190 RepID=A0AAN7BRA9_9PEZI|nr:4'-demethylrebeccamycin synthase [Podospora fimiseda]
MGDAILDTKPTVAIPSDDKPVVVIVAFMVPGHMAGPLQCSKYLSSKGYKDIYFLASAKYKTAVEHTGANFVENPWTLPDDIPRGLSRSDKILVEFKHFFIDSAPTVHRCMKALLEDIREKHPDRKVVMIHESMSLGLDPFNYGAPLPKGYTSMPKAINFQTSLNFYPDPLVPPVRPVALEYDPTPENLRLWQEMREEPLSPLWTAINDHLNKVYATIPATAKVRPNERYLDQVMVHGDVTVVPTSPSLDYPRANVDPVNNRIHFIGGLPLNPVDPNFTYPSWWSEITENASSPNRKKVVLVTQGTIDTTYDELLLPTVRALADRDDLIVVATLGIRNEPSPLSPEETPKNTKIIDYLPYDAVLPYSDVFVSNAGYGGFMHGVMNGVPMVLGGIAADKPEVCMRAEWAGVTVNLRTDKPSEEQVRDAINKVLGNDNYKKRIMEVKKENEEMDSLGTIERLVAEFGRA